MTGFTGSIRRVEVAKVCDRAAENARELGNMEKAIECRRTAFRHRKLEREERRDD